MGKYVQLPETVLADIIRLAYYLDDYELDDKTSNVLNGLLAIVDGKLEARKQREVFTAYKTAIAGTDEREDARNRYLDSVGIHRDWRTSKEKNIYGYLNFLGHISSDAL